MRVQFPPLRPSAILIFVSIKKAGLYALAGLAAGFLDEAGRRLANRLVERYFPEEEEAEETDVEEALSDEFLDALDKRLRERRRERKKLKKS